MRDKYKASRSQNFIFYIRLKRKTKGKCQIKLPKLPKNISFLIKKLLEIALNAAKTIYYLK